MAVDEPIRRKTETSASDSQPAKTKMDQQKMPLVHQRLSLLDNSSRHVYGDDDVNPMDEELTIVVGQQSREVEDFHNPDGKIDYVPLRTVRPESVENGQEKCPGFCDRKGGKKTSTGLTYKFQRKRRRSEGSKSAKSKIEQKPALFDSSSGSSSHSKGDKDDDFEPLTPTRKRGRRAGSKFSKSKMEQKPLLVHRSSSNSSSEGKRDNDDDFKPERRRGRTAGSKSAKRKTEHKPLLVDSSSDRMKDMDDDFEPEVSDDDNGHNKYARVKGAAWNRALEVKKKLPAEGPSFVKCMTHSQVVKGFWLGLPASFCRNHLPEHDDTIVLEDEEGKIYETHYIAYKTGLSGGWKGFVKQQHLQVDDAMVFQLVRPTTFKVYILRENKFTAIDGVLGLLSLNTSMENSTSEKGESSNEDAESKEEEREVTTVTSQASDSNNPAGVEAADGGIRSPGPDTGDFVAMKRLVNFKIVVGDGSVVSSRVLPDHLRRTYYDLCQARKAFLHRHLLKQISPELATAVIVETAKIAEGIRASSPASLEDLEGWKKTLGSFEPMGMDVAFMRKRVDDLLGLLSDPSQTSLVPEGYEEVKLERARVAKQLRELESRVLILKDDLKEMDVKMEEMVEASARKKDQAVRKLATAPW